MSLCYEKDEYKHKKARDWPIFKTQKDRYTEREREEERLGIKIGTEREKERKSAWRKEKLCVGG